MLSKRFDKSFLLLFSFGLVFCCLVSSEIAIDNTLYIRRFFFSSLLFLVLFYFLFHYQKIKLYVDNFSLIYLIYVIFKILSVSWSINKSVAVGEASKRLEEDGLRIMRAYRFMCHNSGPFIPDENLSQALIDSVENLDSISRERIREIYSSIN